MNMTMPNPRMMAATTKAFIIEDGDGGRISCWVLAAFDIGLNPFVGM